MIRKSRTRGEHPSRIGCGTQPVPSALLCERYLWDIARPSRDDVLRTDCSVIRKSRTRGQDPSRIGYGTQPVASVLVFERYLRDIAEPSRADALGTASICQCACRVPACSASRLSRLYGCCEEHGTTSVDVGFAQLRSLSSFHLWQQTQLSHCFCRLYRHEP